jgi:hypothetical protein
MHFSAKQLMKVEHLNFRSFILTAILNSVAGWLLRTSNELYEWIRDDFGIEWVLGLVALAILLLLLALKLVSRAISN